MLILNDATVLPLDAREHLMPSAGGTAALNDLFNYADLRTRTLLCSCFYGIPCCGYPVVTIYGTDNVISHAECFVPLQQEFSHKCAVPNMAGSFSSLVCFPGRLLRNFLTDSEMIPVAPGITFLFVLHMQCTFNPYPANVENMVSS